MKIAVIGSGNVGGTLGVRWAQLGHAVRFGTRDPDSEKVQALLDNAGTNASAMSVVDAVHWAEVVVLAIPWSAVAPTLDQLAADPTLLAEKVLIDCTNPIGPGFELVESGETSGGEEVAKMASWARVVKAFNSTGAENMADPRYPAGATVMFICGDDAGAKGVTTQLATELGFEVADVGALKTAGYLEGLAMVWIHLAIVQGMGRNMALQIVRR